MPIITHVVIKKSTFGTPYHQEVQAFLKPFIDAGITGPYPPPMIYLKNDPGPTMVRTWDTLENAQAYLDVVSKWTDEYVERCYIAEIIPDAE